MPGTKNVHKQLGKVNKYREISSESGVVASTACEKVNTTGTDESLFRLAPVPGHGVQISSDWLMMFTDWCPSEQGLYFQNKIQKYNLHTIILPNVYFIEVSFDSLHTI